MLTADDARAAEREQSRIAEQPGFVLHSYPYRETSLIIDVLTRAVRQGGSSLRDFVSAEGKTGYFQLEAAVYGRATKPCRICGTPIRSLVQGQRTTFYCPTCQKS